jgi:imidazolonepropionase
MNLLIKNIRQLITVNAKGKPFKSGKEMENLGIIEDATILIHNGLFSWIGPNSEFTQTIDKDIDIINASDLVALPGFADSHTHLVFAGSCEKEFGKKAKCDILNIIKSTRAATKKELKKLARRHLDAILKQGTTTLEIGSGYGLNEETEIKMLDAINDLSKESLVDIIPTFFGAQFIPPEFKENPDEYIELVCKRLLPYIAQRKLAKFCEAFCDPDCFSVEQCGKIFRMVKSLGMDVKIQSDRFNQVGTPKLADEACVVSVSCLEHIDDEGIEALKKSGAIAIIFPGDSFFTHSSYAPGRKIIDAGIPLAIASNFNPLSCMSYSMPLMMTIACSQMSLSPEEAISAATLNGAAALGLSGRFGSIEIGKQADIVLYNVPNYLYLLYHFGTNHVAKVIKRGTYLDF